MFKLNMFNYKKKQCCVCYEKKRDVVKCENKNCKDGIICKLCLSKMSESQKKCCQICRVESNNFKVYPKTLVNDIENQIVILTPKNNKITFISCSCYQPIQILIAAVCIVLSTYALGIMVFYMFCSCDINNLARTSNPVMIAMIGAFLSFLCICCIICMRIIIKSNN